MAIVPMVLNFEKRLNFLNEHHLQKTNMHENNESYRDLKSYRDVINPIAARLKIWKLSILFKIGYFLVKKVTGAFSGYFSSNIESRYWS